MCTGRSVGLDPAGVPSRALALNPALDLNQYSHTAWKNSRRLSREARLRPSHRHPTVISGWAPSSACFGSMAFERSRGNRLRIIRCPRTTSGACSRPATARCGSAQPRVWRDGRMAGSRVYGELAGRVVWRLLEDRQSTVWVSGSSVPAGRLCAIRDRDVKCFGEDGSLGYGVFGLFEDRKGSLWLGVGDGIWRWTPGPPTFFPMPGERQQSCVRRGP